MGLAAAGVGGAEPFPDLAELFELPFVEGVDHKLADGLEVGGGGLEQPRPPGVRCGDLGGAGVARASPALDEALALEIDRESGNAAGAEPEPLGELGDADGVALGVSDL